MSGFLLLFSGIITGPLYDHGYLRTLLVCGSLLETLGLMMTSLAREYYQVFLAQGVCVGLGGGMVYVPSMAAASAMFGEAKRPLVIGIIGSGAGIGKSRALFRDVVHAAKRRERWRPIPHHFPSVAAKAGVSMDGPHHGFSFAFRLSIHLRRPSIQAQKEPSSPALRGPRGIQGYTFRHLRSGGLLRRNGLLHTFTLPTSLRRDEHERENRQPCFLPTGHRQRSLNHRPHPGRFRRSTCGTARADHSSAGCLCDPALRVDICA